MAELFEVSIHPGDRPIGRAELSKAARDCDVLVPNLTDTIDSEMINSFGDRLKLIANFGAGTDHIDVAAARDKGILVSNTPDVVTDDTADMTLALILGEMLRACAGN